MSATPTQPQLDPHRVDVPRFAQQGQQWQGFTLLLNLERLGQETRLQISEMTQNWQVQWGLSGRTQELLGTAGAKATWVNLNAQTLLPMSCQRCLRPLDVELTLERTYRFVANERQAEALDAETDEFDVLVSSKQFDFVALLEDELLMALPMSQVHDNCAVEATAAQPVQLEKPNPFASLAALKPPKA